MPPRTRAVNRVTEVLYEEAINTPLPPTPRPDQKERPPLGELSVPENAQLPIIIDVNIKPKKQIRKKKNNNKENFRQPEVLEDEYESSSSSAVEEARRELRSSHNNFVPPHLDSRPQTPLSRAVKAARRKLSPTSPARTPQFYSEIHVVPPSVKMTMQNTLVAAVESTSSPLANLEAIVVEVVVEDTKIATPSPAVAITPGTPRSNTVSPARSPRIEDSVQAIDALSEALEEIEASLPVVVEDIKPVPTKSVSVSPPSKAAANTTKKRVASAPIRKKPTQPVVQRQPTQLASKKIAALASPQSMKSSTTKPRPMNSRSSLPGSEPTKKPASASTPRTPAPRVASIARAPFVPIKSTRSPTKAAFILPGDAITARKKAALDARLKREEAEQKAQRQFKARPAPSRNSLGGATLPRPDIASQKRKSLMTEKASTATSPTVNASIKIGRTAPAASLTVKKTINKVTTSKPATPVVKATKKPKEVLSKTASKPTPNAANKPRTTQGVKPTRTVSGAGKLNIKSTNSKSTVKAQTTQSPAIKPVTPTKTMTSEEKALAAKKARAEASERGRQLSREWADKQRKKRESLNVAKTT